MPTTSSIPAVGRYTTKNSSPPIYVGTSNHILLTNLLVATNNYSRGTYSPKNTNIGVGYIRYMQNNTSSWAMCPLQIATPETNLQILTLARSHQRPNAKNMYTTELCMRTFQPLCVDCSEISMSAIHVLSVSFFTQTRLACNSRGTDVMK